MSRRDFNACDADAPEFPSTDVSLLHGRTMPSMSSVPSTGTVRGSHLDPKKSLIGMFEGNEVGFSAMIG